MSYPTQEERAVCWGARHKYWACMDRHRQGEAEAIKDDPCSEFRKLYEKSCPLKWVKHFDRKGSDLQFKQKIETAGHEPGDNSKL